MQAASYTYSVRRQSACLISISFFLSAFFFSGYIGNSSFRYRRPVAIGQAYAKISHQSKRAVFYKNADPGVCKNAALFNAATYQLLSSAYSQSIRIRFVQSSRVSNTVSATCRFAKVKMLPGNLKDDTSVTAAV